MAKHSTDGSRRGPSKWLLFQIARAVICFLERVPIGVSSRIGHFVGVCAWLLFPKRRAVVQI